MTSTTTAARGSPPARGRRRWTRQWLPPQHGAWAMLLVPFVLGVAVGGWRWVHAPLLMAWIAAYLATWAAGRWATSRFARRYRRPALAYAVAAAVPGLLVLVAAPRLLWFGLAFAPLTAVMIAAAWQRRERSLGNDLAAVVQACLMTFVAAVAASAPATRALPAFAACLLYFAGTVPYVKTMIRERGDPRWYAASTTYHALALGAAVGVSPWLSVPFAGYLARAVVLPRRGASVKAVGLLEIAGSAALLVTCLAAGVTG